MSSYDDRDPAALDRLEDMLDTYCEARLAPRTAVLARIRANVLAQAGAVSAIGAAENRLRLVESVPARRPAYGSRLARAAFALGFAAMLTLGTSLAVMAAPPGSAFYGARVLIETLSLPAQATARLEGHEKLLVERLTEAQAAADSGDTVGLAAALAAYQTEVDDATLDAGNAPDQLAHLQEMLAKHTAVLTGLAAQLPDQSAIEHAIEASSKAITNLETRTHPVHPTHAPQGGGQGGGHGGDQP